ncbi:MAG: hypothetical protein HY692_02795 [Cyanobacteria bacterium NC_groundwater_1444_Ag_S-0.65um_54_12]|nr:hypothetical protein [Cyanobacteria bacterium NC_groundwater_1444_Ag_S-0.65um_54_12]
MAKRPHEPATYFLDRCLDNDAIFEALVVAGADVERHRCHFAHDCPDEAWLRAVGARGWAVLTRDRKIRSHVAEIQAWHQAKVAVFDLTGKIGLFELATRIASFLPKMGRIIGNYSRPLWATVSASGAITVVKGERSGGIKRY